MRTRNRTKAFEVSNGAIFNVLEHNGRVMESRIWSIEYGVIFNDLVNLNSNFKGTPSTINISNIDNPPFFMLLLRTIEARYVDRA